MNTITYNTPKTVNTDNLIKTAKDVHPLENATAEKEYFLTLGDTARASWRRLCEFLTGSLPTYAVRKRSGLTPRISPEVFLKDRLAGMSKRAIAEKYGMHINSIKYHLDKAKTKGAA